MRWSLVISAFIVTEFALSFICAALPVPQSLIELERRSTKKVRKRSATYRKNAMNHRYAYDVNPTTGSVIQKNLKTPKERRDHGKKMMRTAKMQADHVYELQAFKHNLEANGMRFGRLDKKLKKEVKDILNGPRNMAFIPANVNQAKGRLVGEALRGKNVKFKPDPTRDKYTRLSYPTAKNTAKAVDRAFKKHGHKLRPTFESSLDKTMRKAKILPTKKRAGRSPGSRARKPKPKVPRQPTSNVGSRLKRFFGAKKGKVVVPTKKRAGSARFKAGRQAPKPKVPVKVKAGQGSRARSAVRTSKPKVQMRPRQRIKAAGKKKK